MTGALIIKSHPRYKNIKFSVFSYFYSNFMIKLNTWHYTGTLLHKANSLNLPQSIVDNLDVNGEAILASPNLTI